MEEKKSKGEEREFYKKYKEMQKMEEENPTVPIVSPKKRAKRMIIDDEDEIIDQIQREEQIIKEMEEEKEANVIDFNSKFRKSAFQHKGLISSNAQNPFNIGSTSLESTRNYLAWNMSGSVISRKAVEMDYLDIKYSLGDLSQRTLPNQYTYSMADINFKGVLLASTGYKVSEDEYEDDLMTDDMKKARINFYASKGNNKWSKTLDIGENVLAIALGARFSAVSTSNNFIRFFAPEGMEFFILGAKNVISLAAYENVLAILYHGALPFSGNQAIKVKLFDTITLRTILDCPIVISQNSKVKWFGFSSNGNLFIQDSNYTLWSLMGEYDFTPVLQSKAPFWVVGITDNSVSGVRLAYGESEPNPLAQHRPKKIELKIPFTTPEYVNVAMAAVQNKQRKFQNEIWGHMSKCQTFDVFDFQRKEMPNRLDLKKSGIELDRMKVNLVRESIMRGQEEEALWVALQIKNPKVFEVCCKLVAGLDKPKFLDKLRNMYPKEGASHFYEKLEQNVRFAYQPLRDITRVT
jgi:hypothetical protein